MSTNTITPDRLRAATVAARKHFGEIPAAIAMVAWNPIPEDGDVPDILKSRMDGRIIVIPHPDKGDWCNRLEMSDTDGACWSHWEDMTTRARVDALLALAIEIGVYGGISMKAIHEAFSVVPEYRKRLDFCSDRKNPDTGVSA